MTLGRAPVTALNTNVSTSKQLGAISRNSHVDHLGDEALPSDKRCGDKIVGIWVHTDVDEQLRHHLGSEIEGLKIGMGEAELLRQGVGAHSVFTAAAPARTAIISP